MTATPAPALSDAEQKIVDRFDIFAPERAEAALVETVARAIHAADDFPGPSWEDDVEGNREDYRRLAAAAIAAMPAHPAVEAVKRVEALAEEWRYKGEYGWGPWQAGEGPDIEGQILDDAALCLRRALAPQPADAEGTRR